MSVAKTMRNKAIRGHILYLLNLSHPTPTTGKVLETGMLSSMLVTSPDIGAYLDYLIDRGYIERTDKPEYNITYYTLTSEGIDLMEGTITDNGVILNGGY